MKVQVVRKEDSEAVKHNNAPLVEEIECDYFYMDDAGFLAIGIRKPGMVIGSIVRAISLEKIAEWQSFSDEEKVVEER